MVPKVFEPLKFDCIYIYIYKYFILVFLKFKGDLKFSHFPCFSEAVLTPENLTFPVITSTSLQVGWQMAESLMWKFNVTCTGTSVSKTEQELEIMVANFIGLTPGDEYSVTVTAYFTNDVNIEYSAAKPATQSIGKTCTIQTA